MAGMQGEIARMQSQSRLFDDIARVASGAAGALSGVRGEIEARLRDQLERVLAGMDLVSREEFEATKAMAARAREEQENLLRRVESLEARITSLEQAAQKSTNSSTQ
jgi:BMFP domain-containing protein YqiC